MDKVIPSEEDPLLRPSQVAKIFSVTVHTVRLWCRDGKIDHIKLPNGEWRILKSSMIAHANKMYGSEK